LLTREEVEDLRGREGPCVSIYMPTHRAGPETEQDPVRFKNLLQSAEEELTDRGQRRPEAIALLAPARDLLGQQEFWRHQCDGLAMLLAPGFSRAFELPFSVQEELSCGERFLLKPLLPGLSRAVRYHVLALSQKSVRLLEVRDSDVQRVDLGDTPSSLTEALGEELRPQALQHHVATARPSTGGPSRNDGVFHAHGGGEDDVKPELKKFFGMLDRGVGERLEDRNQPLVLAAVEYLMPIYREVTKLQNVVDEGVDGNPEGLSDEQLRDAARKVIDRRQERERGDLLARFAELIGEGRATGDVGEAMVAAHDGRVDKLLVPVDRQCWGRWKEDTHSVEIHEQRQDGDADLVEAIAIETYLRGGTVHTVRGEEIPAEHRLAAIFRY
jgi:hypothetical protein